MVSKGQIVGIDWNRITRLHSHVLAHMNSLTASRCHITASHMGSNPIWGLDFFPVYVSPRIYIISVKNICDKIDFHVVRQTC